MPRMTAEQCEARGHALQEAAEHLLMSWTECPEEIAQGQKVSSQLHDEAERWFAKAKEKSK